MNPFDIDDPQSAKLRFNLRPALNWFVILLTFALVAAVFDSALLDIIAGVILYFAYSNFLDKRTIGFKCQNKNCGKHIETNRPWICGNKDGKHRNDNVDDFPLIHKCEHCSNEPKAYECHHCGELIFFTKDQSKIGFAKCADIREEKPPTPVKTDEVADAIAKQNADIRITELKVKKAKLDAELMQIEKAINPEKEMTQHEILSKSAQEFMDRNLSGPKIVEQLRAKYAEEFKNNPAELAKANLAVDAWAKNNLHLF